MSDAPITLQQLRRAAAEAAPTTAAQRKARSEAAHSGFQQELLGERAAALGRAGRKIEEALARLAETEAAWDRGSVPYVRYLHAWRDAYEARWEMEVLREAIGLVRHDHVYREWPLPARRPPPAGE